MSLLERQRTVELYARSAEAYSPTLVKLDDRACQVVQCDQKSTVVEVWRSRSFLAVIYAEDGAVRLTVNRVTIQLGGKWEDRITWDELMQVKREIGRGDQCAIEIYPPDSEVVNVANMRHLWLLDEPHPFMWRRA